MKTFTTFLESLGSELPYQVKIQNAGELVATVDDGDGAYWQIEFDRTKSLGYYTIHVMLKHSKSDYNRPTDSRSATTALKVYSTVGRLIQTYIKRYPSDYIRFTPYEQKMKNVYERFAKRIAKAVNGTFRIVRFDQSPFGDRGRVDFVVDVGPEFSPQE